MFSRAWAVSGPTPPGTSRPVLSVPSWPERYSMEPTWTAAENGRSVLPAIGTCSMVSRASRDDEPAWHPETMRVRTNAGSALNMFDLLRHEGRGPVGLGATRH